MIRIKVREFLCLMKFRNHRWEAREHRPDRIQAAMQKSRNALCCIDPRVEEEAWVDLAAL